MIDHDFARHFADDWIAAWNRHDLDRILTHYSDDFTMSSPYIVTIAGESSGTLKGKTAVRAYWEKALAQLPDLHFKLVDILVGTDSLALYYMGVRGLAAEVFHFDEQRHVTRALAHYSI